MAIFAIHHGVFIAVDLIVADFLFDYLVLARGFLCIEGADGLVVEAHRVRLREEHAREHRVIDESRVLLELDWSDAAAHHQGSKSA